MTKRNQSSLEVDESVFLRNSPILISGCLLGIRCRYDGRDSGSPHIISFSSSTNIIPFCPEQLGGLTTPRLSANIVGGDGRDVFSGTAQVISSGGRDVTDAFRKGAEESLRLARVFGAGIALLKDKSPSCGLSTPYCDRSDGSGMGVTAALLRSSGVELIELGKDDTFPTPGFFDLLKRVYG